MKVNMHKNCHGKIGVKMFNCVKCGSVAHNYYNGVNICPECLFKGDLCCICGKPMADEKPISTEELANNLKQMTDTLNGKSENPYGRKIYLAEAFHACRNHNLCIKDSNGVIWELNGKDFYSNGADGCPRSLSIFYPLEDLIMETFEVIAKPDEEVKEKWIPIKTEQELCSAIVKGKHIKLGGVAKYKSYDDNMIDYLYGHLKSGLYKMSYLEEN